VRRELMRTDTYLVQGMTCGHCSTAVTAELEQLPGVRRVVIELGSGQVKVTSETELDRSAVQAAVAAAGYVLA
jgi:copper chaperone CopZ